MSDGILYNSNCTFVDRNRNVYSCDMLRIKGYLSDDDECEYGFHKYFDNPMRFDLSDVSVRTKIGTFKYLWTMTCKHTSVTVLHWFNAPSLTDDDRRMVVLEFNPNKLVYEDFLELDRILQFLVSLEIVRVDLAMDIPLPRSLLHLLKDNRNYEYQDHNQNGITEYLGSRNTTNYVKLYDKQKESKLDGAMTRLEFTCSPDMVEFKKHLPHVLVEHEQIALELMEYSDLNSTQIALVSCLKALPVHERVRALKELNYRLKTKLSPYVLTDTYELNLDFACVGSVFSWCKTCIQYKSFARFGQTNVVPTL